MAPGLPLTSASGSRSLRVLFLASACAALAACAVLTPAEQTSPTGAGQAALQEEPTEEAQDTADVSAQTIANPAEGRFAVHEWGLVVTGGRGGLVVGTQPAPAATRHAENDRPPQDPERDPRDPNLGSPPPRDGREIAPARPVFYVHLDPGLDEARFSLGVRSISRGRVIEHYPAGVRQERNTGLTWNDVVARRGACRGVYPGLSDPLCQTPDGVCELADLASYETSEAACLSVGTTAVGLLFYRMVGARDTLPLDVRTHDAGSLLVRSVGAPPRGLVLRVHRDPEFARTRVRVVQLDRDGRATIPPARAPGLLPAERGLALLSAALDEGGLTAQERDAFLRAWREGLFGSVTAAGTSSSVPTPDGHPLAPVSDALLYFWPRAEVDAALPLTITPAPREVRRVFVVRVDLSQAGPQSTP